MIRPGSRRLHSLSSLILEPSFDLPDQGILIWPEDDSHQFRPLVPRESRFFPAPENRNYLEGQELEKGQEGIRI
ncbi:hypothetical protein JTE90_019569 [Oedothorax gibbosus]|uniref:Uncharacterized protein n=1 Tax=Oedothorax gibbosus TaxID=931172 RepID=A0AAV6V454_9ARAC|nr:hypothetical protein JTE90_019569 [Oedothorax gibbosus]